MLTRMQHLHGYLWSWVSMKVVEMGTQSNAAPVIIRRKKIIAGGHHGGAWKVAIADLPFDMVGAFSRRLMIPHAGEGLPAF